MHLAGTLESATQQAGGITYHTGFEQPWSIAGDASYHPSAQTYGAGTLANRRGSGDHSVVSRPGVAFVAAGHGAGEIEGLASTLPGPLNALRLPGPLRVDVGLRRDWRIDAGGSRNLVTTTLRLNNVLGRPDPVGLVAEPDGSFRLLSGTPRGLVLELGWRF